MSSASAVDVFQAADGALSDSPTIPSMLTRDERALYRSLASGYRGEGSVIEFGTWLGSGTFEICKGLEQSGRPWSLTVFDRFVWNEGYDRHYPQPGLKVGDSFQEAFFGNLAPYRPSIEAIAGDLADIASLMPLSRDVELVFVDAPKSWRMLWRVMEHLGPRLTPGSRLVFQDFFHLASRQLVWLLTSIPQLRLTSVVREGVTAVFVAETPIVDLAKVAPPAIKSLGKTDLLEIWARATGQIPESRHGELAIGMSLDLMERAAFGEAQDILRKSLIESPYGKAAIAQLIRQKRKAVAEAEKMEAILQFVQRGEPLQPS